MLLSWAEEHIAYTFFNGDTSTLDCGRPVNGAIANAFQKDLTKFAMTGVSWSEGYAALVWSGTSSTVTEISNTAIERYMKDPANRLECKL